MKTKIKCAVMAFILIFQINLLFGQGGTSCSNAVELFPSNICNYTNYISTGGEMWFKFTATSENVHISLVTVEYGIDLPHIHNLRILEGTCINTVIREDKDLPFSDSIDEISLDMISYGLIVGNTYFIKASRIPHEGDCDQSNCTNNNSTDQATFDICIKDLNIVIPPNSTDVPSKYISYLQNNGQVYDINGNSANDVKYYTTNSNPATYVLSDRAAFVWEDTDSIAITNDSIQRIDLTFPNNIGPSIYSSQQTADLTNFYTEHFPNGLISNRSFSRIIYNDLYKNIDLHYYSSEDGLKFYYVIKPGGDPMDIIMELTGANSTNITTTSGLAINSFMGQLKFKKATVQAVDLTGSIGSLTNSGSFYSTGADQYQIVIEPYNPTSFIVITIEQEVVKKPNGSNDIEWSTYFGGNNNTSADAMDVDNAGNFYVIGTLNSTNFPASNGVFDQTLNGSYDGYLSQFNSDYKKEWLTYYGGDQFDRPFSLDHDEVNDVVYVSGTTNSSAGTFIAQTPGFNPTAYADGNIAQKHNFIQRFNAIGQREWSTFFEGTGGQGNTWERSVIKVDDAGKVYCVGNAKFGASNNQYGSLSTVPLTNGDHPICFPTTNSYRQFGNNLGGNISRDIVLMNFDQNLNLIWSTFIGGIGNDEQVADMVIDNTNNFLYIVGVTNSPAGTPCSATGANGFPICTQGAYFQDQIYGEKDGFITRFALNGTLNYSTFFGGAFKDNISGIALDSNGDFFITGSTNSNVYSSNLCSSVTNGLFPKCVNGGYTQQHMGGTDAFIAGFRSLTTLFWSTFFGGTGSEGDVSNNTHDQKIAFNDENELFVFGKNGIQGSNFPITPSSILNDGYFFESNFAGASESYIARFDLNRHLIWCTFYGGDDNEYIGNIVPFEDRLYICGNTASQNNLPYNCPMTTSPYCQSQSGTVNENGFIANLRYDPEFIGIEEINSDPKFNNSFLLYPNPSNDEINIDFNGAMINNAKIEVIDQVGKSLFLKFIKGKIENSEISLNISGLKSGIYYVKITGDNFSSTKSLVKL